MRKLLVAALLCWAVAAQAATVVWTVTKPSMCTAPATPTGCCVLAAPGANPACLLKQVGGSLMSVRADLASDGGTYSTGGNTLSTAALGALGLAYITYGNCWISNGGEVLVTTDVTGKLVNIRIWATSATEATAAAIATSVYLTCDFYGH